MDGPNKNLKFLNEYSHLYSISLSILELATSALLMVASKRLNVHLDGVWKILWRALIEFYITGLPEVRITLAGLGHQSIHLSSVQQGTVCYKPFIVYKFIRFKVNYNFRTKKTAKNHCMDRLVNNITSGSIRSPSGMGWYGAKYSRMDQLKFVEDSL